MAHTVRIGTRGSGLARVQADWVAAELRALGHDVRLETISTRGDLRRDVPIAALGRDGVFVRELERALLDGHVDVAVHSLKDMPTAAVSGLDIVCVPPRASPFDAAVCRVGEFFEALPPGSVVGTSSIRRVVQIKALRPDLEVRPVRGNVDTRLRKLDEGEFDCLVLAAAGLTRLGLADRISELLEPPAFWPAVGQGALGLQTRSDDRATREALLPLDDAAAHSGVVAERACLAQLSAGCLAPVAGWGRVTPAGDLVLTARVFEDDLHSIVHVAAEARLPPNPEDTADFTHRGESPAALGRDVAAALLAAGAGPMLERMRQRAESSPH
ncbi:MAG: hydroxymethylbilane synthase [Planctomycetota bacterium]|jgi:hydroxymethylbilane synthase|nr:hydroxymethylbilane synthase [Planctomycetota bacterium]MDA1201051.1 hydroxymethylbilane synthase [Planctomycetota bacterium]